MNVLHILSMLIPYQIYDLQTFSPFCHFPPTSLIGSIGTQKLLCLIKSNYLFYVFVLGVKSNKLLLNPRSWWFMTIFSSKSFIVLALTFWSLIYYFDLFLNMVWGKGSISFFYMGISSCFITICCKDYSFFIEQSWNPCWNSILP